VGSDEIRRQALWHEIRTTPVAFFMTPDRTRRPGLPDLFGAGITTFFWASNLEHSAPWSHANDITQHHFANRHPLPVGKQSLKTFMGWIDATSTAGYFGNPEFLLDLMPFDGDELAVCVIRATIEATTIEAFGLCRVDAMASVDDLVYRIVEMQFRLVGSNPDHERVAAYCRELRAWWAKFTGKRVRTGRRKGTTRYTRADVESLLGQYLASLLDGDPCQRAGFLTFAAIPLSTWNDWMREWGTSWSDLVRAVRVA